MEWKNAKEQDWEELVEELQEKLRKKNEVLAKTRMKLHKAKNNIQRLKSIVSYQRERILALYQ